MDLVSHVTQFASISRFEEVGLKEAPPKLATIEVQQYPSQKHLGLKQIVMFNASRIFMFNAVTNSPTCTTTMTTATVMTRTATTTAVGQQPTCTMTAMGQQPTGQRPTMTAVGQQPTMKAVGQQPTGQQPTTTAMGQQHGLG